MLEKVAPITLQPVEAELGEVDAAEGAWGSTAEMRDLSLRRASVSPPTRTGWPGCGWERDEPGGRTGKGRDMKMTR